MTTMIHGLIEFKADRLRNEWELVDPRLRGALLEIARFMLIRFGKSFLVTCVMRTPEENRADKGEPDSGHLVQADGSVRAVDVRTRIHGRADVGYPGLCNDEISEIVTYWYDNFRHGQSWSCLYHGGSHENMHLHFQVPAR